MENINFRFGLLSLIIVFSCNKGGIVAGKCFKDISYQPETSGLLLYIDSKIEDKCAYVIQSSYLDKETNRKLIYDGQDLFFNFSSLENDFQLVFSKFDSSGTKRRVSIKHRNWTGDNDSKYVTNDYTVEILYNITNNNKEQYCIIKIHELISAFPAIDPLDAVVVFSSKKGFIGSYMSESSNPLYIIEKKGNILEGLIDYSEYDFRSIK